MTAPLDRRHPDELVRRQLTTLFLRVPRGDWAQVIAGEKTQFRRIGRGPGATSNVEYPRPIVLHSKPEFRDVLEVRLAVLEDVFKEPLGAITPEGLAAENMPDLKAFRHYWSARHRRSRFKPLTIVNVFCFSLWHDDDRERFGALLLEHLYGPWL